MQAVGRKKLRQQVIEELRALGTADDFMNEAAAALLGIHTTDMHAGEVLDREGAMTVGELAGAVGLSPGAATALVARAESGGVPQPSPGRRQPPPCARAALERGRRPRLRGLRSADPKHRQ